MKKLESVERVHTHTHTRIVLEKNLKNNFKLIGMPKIKRNIKYS